MKKTFFMIAAFSCMSLAAQKQNSNILNSNDPNEIEIFLKTAQRDDPRKPALTEKLVALKSSKTIKTVQAARVPHASSDTAVKFADKPTEEAEFRRLSMEKPGLHEKKTVKLLNQLFDNDVSDKNAILLIQNNSGCNMIIKVHGKETYNLPVRAGGENFVVLKKGNYQLSGNACNAKYSSLKSIAKNTVVTLNRTDTVLPKGKFAQNGEGK